MPRKKRDPFLSPACWAPNEFRIFAHGEPFDVDAFLAASTLPPDAVWRRGDPRRCACVESRHETSGVEFLLGDGRALSVREQEKIAIAYIQAYRNELRTLARFRGVETFILGLQYICKLNDGVLGFCLGPSAQLMSHTLTVGIRPNYYIAFDRRGIQRGNTK